MGGSNFGELSLEGIDGLEVVFKSLLQLSGDVLLGRGEGVPEEVVVVDL